MQFTNYYSISNTEHRNQAVKATKECACKLKPLHNFLLNCQFKLLRASREIQSYLFIMLSGTEHPSLWPERSFEPKTPTTRKKCV